MYFTESELCCSRLFLDSTLCQFADIMQNLRLYVITAIAVLATPVVAVHSYTQTLLNKPKVISQVILANSSSLVYSSSFSTSTTSSPTSAPATILSTSAVTSSCFAGSETVELESGARKFISDRSEERRVGKEC